MNQERLICRSFLSCLFGRKRPAQFAFRGSKFSKLPIRQKTLSLALSFAPCVSKLPIRQKTCAGWTDDANGLSKLPIRQKTITPGNYFASFFSKLPIRQKTIAAAFSDTFFLTFVNCIP